MYIKLKELLAEILESNNARHAGMLSAERSKRTEKFRKLSEKLPPKIQFEMIRKFKDWKRTQQLPNIKQMAIHLQFYKLDLPQEYRAIAKYDKGHLLWIWVGTHEAYNKEAEILTQKYSNVNLREDDMTDGIEEPLFNADGSINL